MINGTLSKSTNYAFNPAEPFGIDEIKAILLQLNLSVTRDMWHSSSFPDILRPHFVPEKN